MKTLSAAESVMGQPCACGRQIYRNPGDLIEGQDWSIACHHPVEHLLAVRDEVHETMYLALCDCHMRALERSVPGFQRLH